MSHLSRRLILIKEMDLLESKGISCRGCAGTCCTFESNSMMVTPLEACELKLYLAENNFLTVELKAKFLSTVQKYRLTHPTGNGKRSFIRRTYTCPFFNHQELGCPLPREIKPYGCLAFNTHHPELKATDQCYSDLNLLEAREKNEWQEEKLNTFLKEKFKLYWEKSPLPVALLELWDTEINSEDLVSPL